MSYSHQVTVTLSEELVREIDRLEDNRGKFVAEAVRNELGRRRHEEFLRSLQNPHPEASAIEPGGFKDWAQSLPAEDALAMVNFEAGTSVRWIAGKGCRGAIVLVELDPTIGREQRGLRPCVVVSD